MIAARASPRAAFRTGHGKARRPVVAAAPLIARAGPGREVA